MVAERGCQERSWIRLVANWLLISLVIVTMAETAESSVGETVTSKLLRLKILNIKRT